MKIKPMTVCAKDKGLGSFYEINRIIFALEKVGK
jgi:hypothetical protein